MSLHKGIDKPLLSRDVLSGTESELELYSKYVLEFFESLNDVPSSLLSTQPEFVKLLEVRDRMKCLFEMNLK